MEASYHRHDINDSVWALLEPHLPGQRGQWGGIAQDNRRFINAVFWVLRTGAPGVICHLIEGISAEVLLADRGYDTNDILAYAVSAGMEVVIPPKKEPQRTT